MHTNETRTDIFIGSKFVPAASEEMIEVISPVTEEVIGRVPAANKEDIDRAVAAARSAFDTGVWSELQLEERIGVLGRFLAAYSRRREQIAEAISSEVGSPIEWSTLNQASAPIAVLKYYMRMAPDFDWERVESTRSGPVHVRREPVGVVAAIVAWNAPHFVAFNKIVPALIAGCSVVLKTSPENGLSTQLLAEAATEAGFPKGALSIVAADRGPSAHLAAHPSIDEVAFTGSVGAGQAIMGRAASHLTRVHLELGGKSAAIVLDDADLDRTMEELVPATIPNNGQACVAMSRVLAPRSRYEEIVRRLAMEFRAMTIGNPLEPTTIVGPLASERQRERVEGYIAKGIEEGARVVVGGGRPAGFEAGWYVEPTLFADVDNSMTIAREEIFGPVVVVIPFDDDDEAIRIANDSDYGLHGTIFSADEQRAMSIARRLRTGNVSINGYGISLSVPFGGYKKSGIGRELGPEGLDAFLESKSIYTVTGR